MRILPVLTYYILQEKYNPFLFEFGATLGVGYRHVKFRMENVENDPWEARLTYFDAERIKVSIKASTFFRIVHSIGMLVHGEVSIGGPLIRLGLGYQF